MSIDRFIAVRNTNRLFAGRKNKEIFGVIRSTYIRSTTAGTYHFGHKDPIQIATNSILNFLPPHLQLHKPSEAY